MESLSGVRGSYLGARSSQGKPGKPEAGLTKKVAKVIQLVLGLARATVSRGRDEGKVHFDCIFALFESRRAVGSHPEA